MADTYDFLTSDRPYRKARSAVEALLATLDGQASEELRAQRVAAIV